MLTTLDNQKGEFNSSQEKIYLDTYHYMEKTKLRIIESLMNDFRSYD